MNFSKYKNVVPFSFQERTWPNRIISKAPKWCSVDLRDGNQALPVPMTVQEKTEMFLFLVRLGFKEIEVGFPSASETEFEFLRKLIDQNLIPEDVTIQVITQSREHLIERTFEAIEGAKKVILHFYNSTSALQRKVVFQKDKPGIIQIATDAASLIKTLSSKTDTKIVYQYSPESFTGTEPDFAIEICQKVMDVLKPDPQNKMILNLPATVEVYTPNVYADVIEYFISRIQNRESVIISLHTHNDRGTGVAATELGLLAGAERVEGTLLGNGERTGNADIVNLALNLYTQGIDPELSISDINEVVRVFEKYNKLKISKRHPYAGSLVFTAFSGSHQDAIRKGMQAREDNSDPYWKVPYLPIDPSDIGRAYEPIVRINSQSGKGGVAFVLESEFDIYLSREKQTIFAELVQGVAELTGREITKEEIYSIYEEKFLPRFAN